MRTRGPVPGTVKIASEHEIATSAAVPGTDTKIEMREERPRETASLILVVGPAAIGLGRVRHDVIQWRGPHRARQEEIEIRVELG